MPVRETCGNCGAPVPDDASVFCNRCGARLPATGSADNLTCPACKKTVTDRQSRFCDHCGSPLAPAAPVVAPPIKPAKGRVCPGCGFENFGENLFYCKKCGTIFPKNEPVPKSRAAEKTSARRPHDGPIRIIPDGMDALRQRPLNAPAAARQTSVDTPVAIRRPPAKVTGETQVLPRKPRREAREKRGFGSYRKLALGAAGGIIILLAIAFITGNLPGISPAGSDNATARDASAPDATAPDESAVGASAVGASAPDAKAPGLLESLPWGIFSSKIPFLNQATPVVTDTPVTPEE